MKDYFPITCNSVSLERKEFQSEVRVDLDVVRGTITDTEVYHDMVKNQMIHSLRATIYGKTHPAQHVVSVPADWIETLKNRFAPLWYLKRSPVKMRHFEASLTELFPTLTPKISDHLPVMRFQVYEKPPTYVHETKDRNNT